jgi:hypothetical protein
MKRSEAIRLIYDVLTENEKYDNVSTSRELLGKLEEAGMLPPGGLEVVSPSIIYYTPDGDLQKYEDSYDVSYLWEPEDD